MNELEDFVVREPYQPNSEESQAIAELEAKGIVADDWDSGNRCIKTFKKNLRDEMYKKQNKLCAFCRIHVPISCVPMHREHIVHKDGHPQWTFLPQNLCVSCPCCNIWKGTTEVLVDPQTRTYPQSSDGFKIIHPFYDKYSDHIHLLGGVLYQGKTEKGNFTIETCHLFRVSLAEERVDQMMYAQNRGDIVAELVHIAKLSNDYVDDNDAFLQRVREIVGDYKRNSGSSRTERS